MAEIPGRRKLPARSLEIGMGPAAAVAAGVIFLSSAPLSASVSGGVAGYSDHGQRFLRGNPRHKRVRQSDLTITAGPGGSVRSYCSSADLSVSDVGTPNPVSPGGTITYTQIVTNNSTTDAVNNGVLRDVLKHDFHVDLRPDRLELHDARRRFFRSDHLH